jgi:hypothetical protein
MLRFPYLEEPIQGSPPPSLPASAAVRWRPLVPVTVHGTGGSVSFGRALVDSGADDTILPLDVAVCLGVALLLDTGHAMRWQGQRHVLRFGHVDLELVDDSGGALRWPAIVAFTPARVRYPLLGLTGCLEFMEARFVGSSRVLELQARSNAVAFLSP